MQNLRCIVHNGTAATLGSKSDWFQFVKIMKRFDISYIGQAKKEYSTQFRKNLLASFLYTANFPRSFNNTSDNTVITYK